jgi:V8-like Glu-specific endopeptidase
MENTPMNCLGKGKAMQARIIRNAAMLGLGALFIGSAPAAAQVAGFNPADYGKAQLPARQSTGDAASYIEANKGAFEPIGELDPADPMMERAKPIGRIDVVLRNKASGEEIGTSCTGTLLPGNRVLTNHHCLPVEGEFEPVKASILMNYLTLDGKEATRFDINVKPLAASAKLDFALANVEGDANSSFGSVKFRVANASPGQSLLVIHHPLGRPKMMSRFRCLAMKEQPEGVDFRHRCDTLGGSSGSLLFNADGAVVALHKEGGLDPKDATSFNAATLMSAILAENAELRQIAEAATGEPSAGGQTSDPATPAKQTQPEGSLSIKEMNDVLKGQ